MNVSSGRVDCLNNYNDYLDTQENSTCHVCLSASAVVGLSFHAQMGLISLGALLTLLSIIARNYYRNWVKPPSGEWRLFRGNVDILMLNLIFADILMSFGAISDIYWAHNRQVFCGSYCDAQGVVQTMGETAAALSTLSVATYTFMAVHRNRRPYAYRPWLCLLVVSLIWLWVLLWAVVPLRMRKGEGLDPKGNVQDYYTPTPWWCWINGKYMTDRIIAEYLWLWVAGVGSIGLYVPSYFTARNQQTNKGFGGHHRLSTEPRFQTDNRSIADSINESSEAGKMLWYPLAYTFCVLPLSIIRWAGFVNPDLLRSSHILAPSMVFSSIFNLMGLINVLLIWWTRPAILLIGSDGQVNPGGPGAASKDDISLRSPVTPHNFGELNNRGAGWKESFDPDEVDLHRANRFGGANVTLSRDV